jgi:cellulose biosynthesis protein BcsQ
MSTKTIAIINSKVGAGKAAKTWRLGDYIATYQNNNTLAFDLDVQRHLLEKIIPFNKEEV